MTVKSKIVLKSAALAAGTLVALAGLSSIPGMGFFAFLWLPGALLAAFIFPEGINSSFAITYVVAAALIDVMLYAIPIYIYLRTHSKEIEVTNE